ncbi:MAG: mercuric transporter MerT family protein [Gemmatimonadaceae bacterium]
MIGRVAGTSSGAVVAGFVSALCCAGPLFAAAGAGGAVAFASVIEPYRPVFLGLAFGSLAGGAWLVRREERRACEPGTPCASPRERRRARRLLVVATIVTLAAAAFPYWGT